MVILKEDGPSIIYVSPVCEVVGQRPNTSPLHSDMAQYGVKSLCNPVVPPPGNTTVSPLLHSLKACRMLGTSPCCFPLALTSHLCPLLRGRTGSGPKVVLFAATDASASIIVGRVTRIVTKPRTSNQK
jgi:hypothetical protein